MIGLLFLDPDLQCNLKVKVQNALFYFLLLNHDYANFIATSSDKTPTSIPI